MKKPKAPDFILTAAKAHIFFILTPQKALLTFKYMLINKWRLPLKSLFFYNMSRNKGKAGGDKLKRIRLTLTVLCLTLCLTACSIQASLNGTALPSHGAQPPKASAQETQGTDNMQSHQNVNQAFTAETRIDEVINYPAFEGYGRLIFPVNSAYYSGETLGGLRLTWYSNIDANKTVEIANYFKDSALAGETIFYDIYTPQEKAEDPAKEDTGLFFFRGNQGEKFAICNAGGGFAYVGAMQDSVPHARELSKRGYNAFALIYRPGAQTACEDLARAISFIFKNAEELGVDTDCYSLWGGSAGGRMAAWLGSYGPAAFNGDQLPKPGAVIMQYTGHTDYTPNDPPTFACVGERDGIANWRTMQNRLNAMSSLGIPTQFRHYPGLGHGFGLGTGTIAQGWLDEAVAFWEAQM